MYTGVAVTELPPEHRSFGRSPCFAGAFAPFIWYHRVMPPTFRNAQQLAQIRPESFEVPTAEELEGVGPGSFVKVSVAFAENEDGMDGERFWVEVTERHGSHLVGKVANEVIATRDHGLVRDDRVEFSLVNVYEVHA
jgi:hypothetical protein